MPTKLTPLPKVTCELIYGPSALPIYYSGPPLSEGTLLALFYFALSGEESLLLDPYNQPVAFLSDKRLRIFSLTLPGHGKGLDNQRAIEYWSENIAAGHNLIHEFIADCRTAIFFFGGKFSSYCN